MERRLGRIQATHSPVNDLYEVALRDTPEGMRLIWKMKEGRKDWWSRALKSELSIRPLFHQKELRVKALASKNARISSGLSLCFVCTLTFNAQHA
jgi:hypothetical protein